jgi:Tat protein translocase TatB subunit
MFVFILESIGMQELLLVGVVALIIFGPRKLPEMAKMIGKTMAEFRRVTGEFKETWEKEAKFDFNDEELGNDDKLNTIENTKSINGNAKVLEDSEINKLLPEIREVNAAGFDKEIIAEKIPVKQERVESEKRNWL